MSTPSAQPPQPSASAPSTAKRTAAAVRKIAIGMVWLTIAAFAPAALMGILGWQHAVIVAMFGGLAAFMGGMMGSGWVTSLSVSFIFAVLAALTVWAAPYPVAAGLVLGVAAFWRGYGARVGLHNALLMTVIALGFLLTAPPTFSGPVPTPIVTAIVALLSGLYVTLVMYLARSKVHPPALTRLVTLRVVAFSVILAVMVGGVAYCVVRFNLGHGGSWIILTILVVFQPYLGAGFKKAGSRVAGTAVGFVLALVIGEFVSSGPLLYVLGLICIMVALTFMMLGKPYWWFVMFLTPSIVLFESAGSTVDHTAVVRLEATTVGVIITLVVMLLLSPAAKYLQTKSGASNF